jgi:hypothetical protein
MVPRTSRLRALPDPDDSEPTVGLAGVKAAADTGSRRTLLVALRDRISLDIDAGVPPRDLASLSLRLLVIAQEIEAIDALEEGDEVGDAANTPDEPWRPSP